ncbi:MAG: amino acid adenylation domain-containing protein [Cyanobacteria bacterium J06621_3]
MELMSASPTVLELTPAQHPLWLGQKLAPDAPLYNMAFLFTLREKQTEKQTGEQIEKLDADRFQAAFRMLVRRCDALRIVINEEDGKPQQRVLKAIDDTVAVLNFQDKENAQAAAREWCEQRSQQPFHLSVQLFDTALIHCPNNITLWYLNQHHLITDMVSLKQLYQEMSRLYEQLPELADSPSPLPAYANVDLPAPAEKSVAYWRSQQEMLSERSPLPLYHRIPSQPTFSSTRISHTLSPQKTAALKQLSTNSTAAALTPQLSLFNLISGLVLAYLHRISDSSQVAIATPAQGRPSAALKKTIGVFIELFPLQVTLEPGETLSSLLSKVSEASGNLLRHAQPGASQFAPARNVNVVLNFLTANVPDFAGHPMQAEWLHPGASDAHHPLRILIHDFDNRGHLQLHFDFNNDLFDPALQKRACTHFLKLIDAALADLSQPVATIDLVDGAEKRQLDHLSKGTPLPITETVVQRFEAQVERSPDAIALTCNETVLTYQQLNNKANQLAHLLISQGVTTETPVALFLHRSLNMLVAIWGVLKAGGTYVPIDPTYPASRVSFILQDTAAKWVITQSTLSNSPEVSHSDTTVIAIDQLDLTSYSNNNLPSSPELNQLAYCLYTSGSTGTPKGVEIEHRSLANYIQWAEGQYVRGRQLAFPLFSPLSFDLTVTSLYLPLISGGQAVIYPEDEAAIDLSLQRIFQENAVDVIKLTPSHLALVRGMPMPSRLKVLVLGGEDLKASLAKEVTQGTSIELYNEYGPTEATVGCMIHRFDPDIDSGPNSPNEPISVPIGRPAAGVDIHLLDEHFNRVPLGDVGEIFVGGPGLARGYLNLPALTAERFVTHEGARLYRTGDLGRWGTDGELAYLGRCDLQVKLNGIRIEPGEIEAALITHLHIHDCIVQLQSTSANSSTSSGHQQLIAYYVPTPDAELSSSILRNFLTSHLPSRIRPTRFVAISSVPLTPNGKVDLKALPTLQETNDPQSEFVAPEGEHEKMIAQIWQQLLHSDRISRHDNFFDLGGDSITAIQIAARLSEARLSISPNQLFTHSTIAELANVITEKTEKASIENSTATFSLADISGTQLDKLSALLDQADRVGETRP